MSLGSTATRPSSSSERWPRIAPPVFVIASILVLPCAAAGLPARASSSGGSSPIQSIKPATKPRVSLSPKAGTAITRPAA
jgi:hypothetical protein